MFERCIFVSGEDDQYLVYGGIGTYLGVLTKWIRVLYPSTEVIWIAKSPVAHDICEIDPYGVRRIYLAEFVDRDELPFFEHYSHLRDDRLAKYASFLHRIEEQVAFELDRSPGKTTLLEVGEWEGHTQGLFRCYRNYSSLFKVARLHTPLAVCMEQNHLAQSSLNYLQMLNEFQQIKHADYLSSCTHYMKERVIAKVLGPQHPLSTQIHVHPNPIDIDSYKSSSYSREESLKFLCELRKESVSKETFNIFIVGSVESRKGVEYVIRAIPETVDAVPNARFCFFGHHAHEDSSWENANAKLHPSALYQMLPAHYHPNLTFFNYIPHSQLPLVMAGGDVFPILSVGDNFPGTVAEIALSAKPIVALERGGVKEMLQDAMGVFRGISLGSDLRSASSLLSKALIHLSGSENLRRGIGENLRELVLNKYDPKEVIPNLMDAYWRAFTEAGRLEWQQV